MADNAEDVLLQKSRALLQEIASGTSSERELIGRLRALENDWRERIQKACRVQDDSLEALPDDFLSILEFTAHQGDRRFSEGENDMFGKHIACFVLARLGNMVRVSTKLHHGSSKRAVGADVRVGPLAVECKVKTVVREVKGSAGFQVPTSDGVGRNDIYVIAVQGWTREDNERISRIPTGRFLEALTAIDCVMVIDRAGIDPDVKDKATSFNVSFPGSLIHVGDYDIEKMSADAMHFWKRGALKVDWATKKKIGKTTRIMPLAMFARKGGLRMEDLGWIAECIEPLVTEMVRQKSIPPERPA